VTRLVRSILSSVFIFIFVAAIAVPVLSTATAHAAATTPTPSASATTTPEVRAGNEIVGLLILTAFAAAGYFVSKWIRRDRRPRPPGPRSGGFREPSSRS